MCRDLAERGVTTSTGRPFITLTLRGVLASARISGRREYIAKDSFTGARPLIGQITKQNAWPAIISVADSDRLRTLLTDPARRTSPGPDPRSLLTGILRCAVCGRGMISRPRMDLRRPDPRYLCSKVPGKPNCGKISIHGPKTDDVILASLLAALDSPELYARVDAAGGRQTAESDEAALDRLRAVEERQDELAASWAAGDIPRREWLKARGTLQVEADRLHRRMAQSQHGRALADFARLHGDLRSRWDQLALGQQRALIKAVIDHVTVHPAPGGLRQFDPDRLEITWRV